MKKFVFQLDALYQVKRARKDQLQKEYSEAAALYHAALEKKDALDSALEAESVRYEARAKKGMTAGELLAGSAFFADLQKRRKSAAADAERARRHAEGRQRELLEAFQDIKALEKLQDKQYEAYLAEEGKQETSRIEDMLSFSLSGQAQIPAGG